MVDPTKNAPLPVRTLEPAPIVPVKALTTDKAKTEEAPKKKPATKAAPRAKALNFSGVPFWSGIGLSFVWIGVVVYALLRAGENASFGGLPLVNWAIGISAIVSPIAMIWMVAAYLQRAADVQSVTDPLRRQLSMIIGESGAAEVRIRRFNQAVREQLDLLRSTKDLNQGDLTAVLERVRQHREELDQFEQHSLRYVKEIQDVIRRSMQHIDQVMEDKFTMLRVLDGKLVQTGDTVSQQSAVVHDQISTLLHEIETNAQMVSGALERAMQDSRKLADTARAQEASLLGAAETASTTIQDLSSRIDVNIAHFLEHTGSARTEAEKLASVLDAQTRTLDDFSQTLPARVSEAESVLHGVADRLYASEQLAREQAISLSDRLSAQVDNLDALLEKFGIRFKDIEGSLQQKQSDFDGLVVRISGAANDLAQQLDTAIANLGLKAQGSLDRFASVNDTARKSTDEIASALAATAERYENATHALSNVSDANRERLRATTNEINAQLARFEALHQAADRAGGDVQTRAASALQNMQQVLEKLLVTREATQSVGDLLTDKLRSVVDQNEKAITRLSEAARMTIHGLGAASEALNRQEENIADKSRASETVLRASIDDLGKQSEAAQKLMQQQNEALRALLKETEEKLDGANRRLVTFSAEAALPVQQVLRQIDESTDTGRESLLRYADNMNDQLHRLQQFNAKVGSMGDELGQMTQETLGTVAQLNERFLSLRTEQEQTTHTLVEQISTVANKMRDEAGALGDKAATVVETLQKTANDVGQQTQTLQRDVTDAGSRIQLVTTTLQTQADKIKEILQKQTDDLGTELSRAEIRFTTLGSTLKQQTDSAYALLDRVATHYDDVTGTAVVRLENQTGRLDAVAAEAQTRIDQLGSALSSQVEKIGAETTTLQGHSARLADASLQTIDHMGRLNATMAATVDKTTTETQKALSVLDEAGKTMDRHSAALGTAALQAGTLVEKASTLFGEQSKRLGETMRQIEKDIQSLDTATTGFADKANLVRATLDDDSQKTLANLDATMTRMDATKDRMQETTATALLGAEQVAARYADVTTSSADKLSSTSGQLMALANKTETALDSLAGGISQQVASLSEVGDKLAAQNTSLAAAHEAQRTQMLALFQRIEEAHAQASDVAARTIDHLNGTLSQIDQKLGSLGDTAQTAVANVKTASVGFSDQADLLLQHAAQAETQARTVLSTTAALQDQAHTLCDALKNEGDKVGGMLADLLARLGTGTQSVKSAGTETNALLTGLHATFDSETRALTSSMDAIADRQRTLTTSLETQREALAGLMNRLALAQDETASAAERNTARLESSAAALLAQIEALGAKTNATMDSIKVAGDGFTDEASALGDAAQKAEQQVRTLFTQAMDLREQARTLETSIQAESSQTREALSGVIGKLDQSHATLRDVTATAERILDSFGAKIQEKAVALGESVQAVSDKQTTLTASMEAQRDALGGLMSRLTDAQDQTVATAQKAMTQIESGVSSFTDHVANVARQSETASETIRAASTGLSTEATRLRDEAAEAARQVRDMTTTTATLRDETKIARESLQSESSQAVEALARAAATINTTVDSMKQQGSQIACVMDQSVDSFSALTKTAAETLDKQAASFVSVAQTTEEKIESVGSRLRDHFKLISDASSLTQDHGKAIADTAEKATSRLVSLCTALTEGDKTAKDIMQSAEKRLGDAKTALQRELDQIAALSAKATEQVTSACKGLSSENVLLQGHIAQSSTALAEASAQVRAETDKVPEALDRSAARIDTTREAFLAKTADIDKALLQTTDRYISTSGAVRDTLMDEAQNLATVADTANKTLTAFNTALSDQLSALTDGTTTMTSHQSAMAAQARTTLDELSHANERLAAIRNEAVQTTDKLSANLQEVETKANASTQRLAVICDAMAKQITQMAQTSERAESQMVASSQGFRDQLERVKGSVQTQIDGINHGLTQITAQLERTSAALKTATTGTLGDVERISARFDKASKDTAEQLMNRTMAMHKATEDVAKLLGGFGDQMDGLLSRLASAGEGLKHQESGLADRLKHAFMQIGEIADKLESSRVLANSVSDDATQKLRGVAEGIDKQIRSLADGAQTVTEIVRSVGQTYADQTQGVTRNVVDAQSQIMSMNKSVEDMQQRTDRLRVTLKLQGEDLMQSLEQILHQLSMAGDVMSDTANGALQRRAAEALQRLS